MGLLILRSLELESSFLSSLSLSILRCEGWFSKTRNGFIYVIWTESFQEIFGVNPEVNVTTNLIQD